MRTPDHPHAGSSWFPSLSVCEGLFFLLPQVMTTPPLHLVPDTDAHQQYTQWLIAEDPATLLHLDGGTYGRPITQAGVLLAYQEAYPKRFDHRFPFREGNLLCCNSYYACLSAVGEHIGHVDCLVVDSPVLGGTVGWLFMVYVVPAHRGRGWGKALVRQALRTFVGSCRTVYLTVLDDNPRAKQMYISVGFDVVNRISLPGVDGTVNVMAIEVPEEA